MEQIIKDYGHAILTGITGLIVCVGLYVAIVALSV